MVFLAFVALVAAGAVWTILWRGAMEDPYQLRIFGAMELLLIS